LIEEKKYTVLADFLELIKKLYLRKRKDCCVRALGASLFDRVTEQDLGKFTWKKSGQTHLKS
jgi:hypothetical protein